MAEPTAPTRFLECLDSEGLSKYRPLFPEDDVVLKTLSWEDWCHRIPNDYHRSDHLSSGLQLHEAVIYHHRSRNDGYLTLAQREV